MKRFLIYKVVIMLAILYAATASAAYERFKIPLEGSPSKGPANAKVTIVEFLDYQ